MSSVASLRFVSSLIRFLMGTINKRYSSLAQSVERMTVNHDVAGSSPAGGAIKTLENTTFSRVFAFSNTRLESFFDVKRYPFHPVIVYHRIIVTPKSIQVINYFSNQIKEL